MKTLIFCLCFANLCVWENYSQNKQSAEALVFPWAARPQLSAQQQKLLQLQSGMDSVHEDSPVRETRRAEVTALEKKLGTSAVRHAKPYELIASAAESNLCNIFNPTKEGLVLTVSVVGDTEQLGSRRASMGRETYLPPGSTVIVSNLCWTTRSETGQPKKPKRLTEAEIENTLANFRPELCLLCAGASKG